MNDQHGPEELVHSNTSHFFFDFAETLTFWETFSVKAAENKPILDLSPIFFSFGYIDTQDMTTDVHHADPAPPSFFLPPLIAFTTVAL